MVEKGGSISTEGGGSGANKAQATGPAIGACAATNAPSMAQAMGVQLGVVTECAALRDAHAAGVSYTATVT